MSLQYSCTGQTIKVFPNPKSLSFTKLKNENKLRFENSRAYAQGIFVTLTENITKNNVLIVMSHPVEINIFLFVEQADIAEYNRTIETQQKLKFCLMIPRAEIISYEVFLQAF